jgi:hypothetical protein
MSVRQRRAARAAAKHATATEQAEERRKRWLAERQENSVPHAESATEEEEEEVDDVAQAGSDQLVELDLGELVSLARGEAGGARRVVQLDESLHVPAKLRADLLLLLRGDEVGRPSPLNLKRLPSSVCRRLKPMNGRMVKAKPAARKTATILLFYAGTHADIVFFTADRAHSNGRLRNCEQYARWADRLREADEAAGASM